MAKLSLCFIIVFIGRCMALLRVDFTGALVIGPDQYANIMAKWAQFTADMQITMPISGDLRAYNMKGSQVVLHNLTYIGNPDPDQPGQGVLNWTLTGMPENFDITPCILFPSGMLTAAMDIKYGMVGFYNNTVTYKITEEEAGGTDSNSVIITPTTRQRTVLPSVNKACARMGLTSLADLGFKTALVIPACEEFHNGPVAIKVPMDTPALKWGAISPLSKMLHMFTFVDRAGVNTEFPSSVPPPWLTKKIMDQSISQIVFAASVSSRGNITAVTAALFIQRRAPILPFRNTVFIGRATYYVPHTSGNNTNNTVEKRKIFPVHWDVGSSLIASHGERPVLPVTFSNLLQGFLNSSNGCQPALCSGNVSCSLFSYQTTNITSDLQLSWLPALISPLDSELVIIFPGGLTYMAALPRLNKLLSSNISVSARRYTFYVLGSPFGPMFSYIGMFKRISASPQVC